MNPGHFFRVNKHVGTKSEVCRAANVTRKVKIHESVKGVWQMRDQGPSLHGGAPF